MQPDPSNKQVFKYAAQLSESGFGIVSEQVLGIQIDEPGHCLPSE